MSEVACPDYGTADHYLGDKGKNYFAWQDEGAQLWGRNNTRKFRHLIKSSDTVIDFGCGGGRLLVNLECARRVGIEINPLAREAAINRGIECYADIKELPDGIADVIVSDHALEHVPFPIEALRQLRAKLKPHGILSLCVPIDNWRSQKRYDPNDIHHHLHTWTPQLLGNTLFEAGYEVISIYARIYAWPGRWIVARYERLPYWLFRSICFTYGAIRGRGWEILSVARKATRAS